MAEVNETAQRQCDRCGAQSGAVPRGAVPDGWLAGLGLVVKDALKVLHDLCPSCASLPVSQAAVPPPPAEPVL